MNALGRTIKYKEEVVLRSKNRVFVVLSGQGMNPGSKSTAIYGYFKDDPGTTVGPIDALWTIDAKETRKLGG